MSENDFERALAESFNNAYNSNVPISTSEANNVNDIFVGNEVKTECIICYEENIPCIKCFQCTAVYCKTCLTKIASDSNKCICSINFKNNYCNLKKYNQNLIKNARLQKEKLEKEKKEKEKKEKVEKEKKEKEKKEKVEKEKKEKKQKEEDRNININNNKNLNNKNLNNNNNHFNAETINNYLINENNYTNDYNSTDTNLNLKLEFLEDLKNHKIYNIDLKSFCNKIDNTTPNFDYYWDYTDKKLTFYHIPNRNNDVKNIVFDYTILNAENQAELYIWILQLLNLPLSEYKKKWNKISDIMPKITKKNKIDMMNKIIALCICNPN